MATGDTYGLKENISGGYSETPLNTEFLKLDQTVQQQTVGAPMFDALDFNIEATMPIAVGRFRWNSTDGTIDIGMLNNSILQVGQEIYFYAKASGNILNGDPCEFAGAQGDHILVKKAVGSEIQANPHYFVGVATQNIANGHFGYVTWFGKINGVYTKTPANNDNLDWATGDVLYFNTVTGYLTKTEPTPPNRIITVAAIIKAQSGGAENGVMIVRPQIVEKLSELSDVYGTPNTTGQFYKWNQVTSRFELSQSEQIDRSSYLYFAQSPTADTAGDWRQYGDDDGFYTQYCTVGNATKGSGNWVTKHTIQI